jgi:hypothetical protein
MLRFLLTIGRRVLAGAWLLTGAYATNARRGHSAAALARLQTLGHRLLANGADDGGRIGPPQAKWQRGLRVLSRRTNFAQLTVFAMLNSREAEGILASPTGMVPCRGIGGLTEPGLLARVSGNIHRGKLT